MIAPNHMPPTPSTAGSGRTSFSPASNRKIVRRSPSGQPTVMFAAKSGSRDRKPGIIARLDAAIEDEIRAGKSTLQIAKEAGVGQPTLQRWMTGSRQAVSLETAEKLAVYFGFGLVKVGKRSKANQGH